MRERSDGVDESSEPGTEKPKRIDLNVPQVAGGAVAAVLAAELASWFGVYGTILGAGVVSVVATCGGTLFQHFLKRTGEQIRDATTAAGSAEQAPSVPGEFTPGTVYRAQGRSPKRPVLAAAVVFGLTMTGITTYELASGHNLSGGRSTTVGDAFSGGGASSPESGGPGGPGTAGTPGSGTPVGTDAPTAGPSGTGAPQGGTASPSTGESGGTSLSPTPTPSATPSATRGEGTGSTTPSASPTPPEPSASSRSGTAGQDRDDPAAP
ncbi:hypothetical protein [Streptomyces hawaiiensis]|uniref:hypothetical protein n=1 Tax=Streptomyces hawaiiensis TaxID=67305 RepID=UPI003647FCD3